MNSNPNNLPQRFTPEILSEYFERIVFDIPIYQRLFAWRDEQVLKLMDDLFEAFPKGENYYLGILTVVENSSQHDLLENQQQLDLIDGQQRMTVTVLMAIAFIECEPENCAYWRKYLANGKRLKFSARNEDMVYISARSNDNKNPVFVNSNMERTITLIKEWCAYKGLDVVKFAEYVWHNLTLFCSYLPKRYIENPIELNRYFEAMNSTGRQLRQYEIVLVDLIAGHPDSIALSGLWQRIADIRKRLVSNFDESDATIAHIREYYEWHLANSGSIFKENNQQEEIFETIEEIKPAVTINPSGALDTSSKEMLISFEELLLMALDLTLGSQSSRQFYQPEHLLARFEKAKLKENGLVNSFFDNLYKCRLLLDYKIVWKEAVGDYDIITEDKEHRIEKFQSMLYVAYQGDFYRWLPEYIKWLMEHPGSTPESELEELKKIDRELHPDIPSVDDLNYHKVDRYWFWRLDYELWEHRNDEDGWLKDKPSLRDVVNRFIFRANRSIEHLYPQTPTDSKSEAWDSLFLHSFGNLAMISSSFNSLQSNESVGVKMERIHYQIETSQLQSLKMLHMWITYKNEDTWTVEKAKIHEEIMYPYIGKLHTEH